MYAMITRLTDIKFYLIHAGSNTKRIFKIFQMCEELMIQQGTDDVIMVKLSLNLS